MSLIFIAFLLLVIGAATVGIWLVLKNITECIINPIMGKVDERDKN